MNLHNIIKTTFTSIVLSIFLIGCGGPQKNVAQEEGKSNEFIYAKDGRLFFPNGEEVALWGVNLQPALSWEYNSLFKLVGAPMDSDTLKLATDLSLDEIEKMDCDLVRVHLTPSDFTNDKGELVETFYLDQLDYMVAEAAKRGMYVYITFLNSNMGFDINVEDPHAHTPTFVENSYLKGKTRKELLLNKELIEKSKVYLKALLDRKNPYTSKSYKETSAIAVWEIVNEPIYYSYKEIKETPYFSQYTTWLTEQKLKDNKENYFKFRHDKVLNYIDGMYDVIRETGAVQPVVWNCNWHRMITKHKDVFDAVAESKVEVVSFCNYPGQSVCKKPYTKNPEDLSNYDFTSFFTDAYQQDDWYNWALTPKFMKKAKVAYEFEIFYNQSGYLYPAQAAFFRAMGVQMATMWHYSMPRYAPYRNGSHHLSLTCTPHKAASYAVAGEVFRSMPLYHKYDVKKAVENTTDHFMYSFKKDLSIYSDKDNYFYSGDVAQNVDPQPSKDVKHVLGYGSSEVVKYEGKGVYRLDIADQEINLYIAPNAFELKPLWGKDWLVGLVTDLDTKSSHPMTIQLDKWNADNSKVVKIENGKEQKVKLTSKNGISFDATPGNYKVMKTAGLSK
ncbi:glycoside hydrolase 5 family protein [Flammeovirga agarivorans]|uniref:Cellulase family glycosylhydrolase n=1 Tax=Flammeovirga agarivorans TaxID=2726742 RepID=A0A7X8XYE8_9BACT|nr:cellulase family glycosylhydrolase [Flammeovirga agarivorans]NLR93965.1 cellulase family glycosylhydrolase [Flammeovirga agarivorans]